MSTVNVTVVDEDSNPVAYAFIGVQLKATPATAVGYLTNASGVASFSATNGASWLEVVRNGYRPVEQTLVVSGTTSVTVVMEAIDQATCEVSGVARDAAGEALEDLEIAFYGGAPQGQGIGTYVMGAPKVAVTTGSGGSFSATLVRGARLRVRCPQLKLDDLIITIPDAQTADLADLIEEALA